MFFIFISSCSLTRVRTLAFAFDESGLLQLPSRSLPGCWWIFLPSLFSFMRQEISIICFSPGSSTEVVRVVRLRIEVGQRETEGDREITQLGGVLSRR